MVAARRVYRILPLHLLTPIAGGYGVFPGRPTFSASSPDLSSLRKRIGENGDKDVIIKRPPTGSVGAPALHIALSASSGCWMSLTPITLPALACFRRQLEDAYLAMIGEKRLSQAEAPADSSNSLGGNLHATSMSDMSASGGSGSFPYDTPPPSLSGGGGSLGGLEAGPCNDDGPRALRSRRDGTRPLARVGAASSLPLSPEAGALRLSGSSFGGDAYRSALNFGVS